LRHYAIDVFSYASAIIFADATDYAISLILLPFIIFFHFAIFTTPRFSPH
jgi:hypothetical protein